MITQCLLCFTCMTLVVAAGTTVHAADEGRMDDVMVLLRSDKEQDRDRARTALLEERARVVKSLLQIVTMPKAQVNDGWLHATTSRNIAIEALGAYRATEAIPALIPLMVPPPGEILIETRPFYLSPAGRALVNIGQPAVPELLAALASTNETKTRFASQIRLILYEIAGRDGGESILKKAIAAQTDQAKLTALEAHLGEYLKMMATERP